MAVELEGRVALVTCAGAERALLRLLPGAEDGRCEQAAQSIFDRVRAATVVNGAERENGSEL